MKKLNGKTVGAFAGAAMLAVTGAASVVPAVAAPAAPADAAAVAADQAGAAQAGAVAVQGSFAYSQDVLTPNATLTAVFSKAAATLCQCVTVQGGTCCAAAIAVNMDGCNAMTATVADMGSKDPSNRLIMGCTCATNGAGGGAIANAEAEGVTLESVLAQAQAAAK